MRRSTPFFCLIALLVGTQSVVFAQGGGKGGIERQSGPGPWSGWHYFGPVGCITTENDVDPFWGCLSALNRGTEPRWWIEFEFGDYESKDDDLVNHTTVDLKRWELRADTLVASTRDSVQVGFGAGAFHYSGEFDSFAKLALPVRVAFYPFKIGSDHELATVFSVWVKQTFLAGRISGEDFGVPSSSFDENWEGVTSYGFSFDFRYFVSKAF